MFVLCSSTFVGNQMSHRSDKCHLLSGGEDVHFSIISLIYSDSLFTMLILKV